MTKYIVNEFGGVHSVDDETEDSTGHTAYDLLLVGSPSGQRFLPAGWREVSREEAKRLHPQLFGAADPTVRMNASELKDAQAKVEAATFYADHSVPDIEPEPAAEPEPVDDPLGLVVTNPKK